MTREEFFYQCLDVIEHWLNGNRKLSDLREVTDKLYNEVTKPHWISVEDELPPRSELNENISDAVITFGYYDDGLHFLVELNRYHYKDGQWLYSQAKYWMPFQHPEKGD